MYETDLLTSQHMRSFSWHLSQLSLTQIMNNLASVSHTDRVKIAVFGLDGCAGHMIRVSSKCFQ